MWLWHGWCCATLWVRLWGGCGWCCTTLWVRLWGGYVHLYMLECGPNRPKRQDPRYRPRPQTRGTKNFCVSRVLNSRHAVRALRKRTGAALERNLVILPSEPAGVQDEWEQTRSQTRKFLKLATMFEVASKDSGDDAVAGDQGLAHGYATLLTFFNGPWTGLVL